MRNKLLYVLILIAALGAAVYAQSGAPKNLKAAVDTAGNFITVKLTWDSVAVQGTNKMHYAIYKKWGGKTDSGKFFREPFRLEKNSFTDRFVTLGKTYSYYVTSVDMPGKESAHSDTVSVTLPSAAAPGVLTGMVTDSVTGNPVKNSVVAAIPLRGIHLKSVRTDSTGHYLLRVEPGTYLLSFSAPRYRSEFYNNQARLNNADRINVKSGDSLTNYNAALYTNVPDRQVTLSGMVKDSAGNPVQARVRALVLTHRFFQHRFMNASTDTSGRYSIKLRAGDSVIVFAQPVNNQYLPQFYNNKSEFFEADKIVLNSDSSGIDFTLIKRAVYANGISGRVTAIDSAGNVSGVPASVTAFKLGKVSPERFRSSVITDSVGNYSLSNLEPGTYIVLAVPERGYIPTFYRSDTTQTLGWRQADTLTVTASTPLTNINFVVRAVPDSGFGQIAGTVKTTSGSGVGGAVILFTDVNQNISGYTISDAQGNYTMPFLAPGTYTVWVDKVNYNGTSQQNVELSYTGMQTLLVNLTLTPVTVTAVGDSRTAVTSYELAQNYPNPFNPSTTISFQIPAAGLVELKVYNAVGQEVATLVNEFRQAGKYNVSFNAAALSSGIYFYKMTAGSFVQTQKMVLLK